MRRDESLLANRWWIAADGWRPLVNHTGEGQRPSQQWIPAFAGKAITDSNVWVVPLEQIPIEQDEIASLRSQ